MTADAQDGADADLDQGDLLTGVAASTGASLTNIVNFDDWGALVWATKDTLDRLTLDIPDGVALNMKLRCDACDVRGMVSLNDPTGPPDPDRWGNRRWTYRCPSCGERVTMLSARHGGTRIETPGFSLVDDD